ncbi:MAG TPA: NAD(P)-binding domain-containing protein [Candidatus Limnocylindria bacterium]
MALPIAIIGAGPVGLAAAAELVARDLEPIVLESGATAGAAVKAWGHVRVFSPWRYDIAPAARALLDREGWIAPDPEAFPTGHDLVASYLAPLAAVPQLRDAIRTGHRVRGVTREGFDKLRTAGRDAAPFVLDIETADGPRRILARAVVDASGTTGTPNPLGAGGTPAAGEAAAADRIRYGIPDVLGSERDRYAGRRILVAGAGHSAFNVLIDLAALATDAPGTVVTWVVRRAFGAMRYGGAADDGLPARGALGTRLRALVDAGAIRQVVLGITAVRRDRAGVHVDDGSTALGPFDEIVAVTGFRPDLAPLRELRIRLDEILEAPPALAPLIDPNLHSCGTVPPHGAAALAHPEAGFYIAGMKSYGRAPTFLMLTGYEQVRSIVAALAGDVAAARSVELVLPETGVCGGSSEANGGCCEAPSPIISVESLSRPR